MSRGFDETDQLCINTVRTLSLDAVEKAKSGHPGLPLGCAPLAHVLWSRHLRFNPADPHWPGRDRFVLSAGHGCMLLYSLLHLTGYDLPISELENFRQWGSRDAGASGVPAHRGRRDHHRAARPGRGHRVGMAIAGKHLECAVRRSGGISGLRDRVRRRSDGGRVGRGLVARRSSGARQPRVSLRRQPRLDRRRHRDCVHRGSGRALRRVRVAHLDGLGRQRPGRVRRRDLPRPSQSRAARRSSRQDDHRVRRARRRHLARPLRRPRCRATGRDQANAGL